MNKIWLVIQREFLTRVKSKQFIIFTLLGPLLFTLPVIFMVFAYKFSDESKTILVADQSGFFKGKIKDKRSLIFEFKSEPPEEIKESIKGEKGIGLLVIPEDFDLDKPLGINYYSEEPLGPLHLSYIESAVKKEIEDLKLKQSGMRRTFIDSLRAKVDLHSYRITEEGDKESNVGIAAGIGIVGGMVMYFFIFFYGMMVLKGVVEEKSNRIVEVIVSSVKPFQLMMGKILGIASVGVFQFLMWAVLSAALSTVVLSFFGPEMAGSGTEMLTEQMDPEARQALEQAAADSGPLAMIEDLKKQNLPYILGLFLFFFFGGYMLYSALFAAIGSAVDNETDTQQLLFPVTIPIIISIVVAQVVIQNPNSTLAFWFSIIPLFSPIVMMVRIPFDPPAWEIYLSMFLLVLGFVLSVWMAAKIYRTGILMYGKKPSLKEIGKWLFYKS